MKYLRKLAGKLDLTNVEMKRSEVIEVKNQSQKRQERETRMVALYDPNETNQTDKEDNECENVQKEKSRPRKK